MSRVSLRPTSQAAGNVADLLQCSVCMIDYDEDDHLPKLLPCHHSFCLCCLSQLAARNSYVDCPTCRQRIVLNSPGGAQALQTNFYVAHMRDLLGENASPKIRGCKKHENKELDYFCKTCEMLICPDCCSSDHRDTAGHVTQSLGVATQEQVQLLHIETGEAQQKITKNKSLVVRMETELGNLFASKDKSQKDIEDAFALYLDTLTARKHELIQNLRATYAAKRENLSIILEDIHKESTSLEAMIDQCEGAITNGSIPDMLAYKAKMASKNLEVRKAAKNLNTGNNFIKFDTEDSNLINLIQNVGTIHLDSPLPSVIKINTSGRAIAGQISRMTVNISSISGEPLSDYPITADILDVFDDTVSTGIKQHAPGSYEINFRPQISGMHRVQVKFLNHSIVGGDCSLNVHSNNPTYKIGHQGDRQSEMEYPRAVAVDNCDNLFVVDTGNSRIQKFDRSGKFQFAFPLSREEMSTSSCGIAIDSIQGVMLCSEVSLEDANLTESHAVLVYTMDGQLCKRLSYRDTLRCALSVAVNSLGQIIIADFDQDAIFVFDKRGKLLRRFGETGSRPGQFKNPTFVASGENDCIIVSDGENHRVQVFDSSGKLMYMFGGHGSGKGQFKMPFGVATDSHGNILVVDGGNKRIQIFKYGEFVSCIESLGDKLNAPRGIAVTSDGHVWVADRDNHCVKKFKYISPSQR